MGNDVAGGAELAGGFRLTIGREKVLELGLPQREEGPMDPLPGATTAELEGPLRQYVHLRVGEEAPEERRTRAVRLGERAVEHTWRAEEDSVVVTVRWRDP